MYLEEVLTVRFSSNDDPINAYMCTLASLPGSRDRVFRVEFHSKDTGEGPISGTSGAFVFPSARLKVISDVSLFEKAL